MSADGPVHTNPVTADAPEKLRKLAGRNQPRLLRVAVARMTAKQAATLLEIPAPTLIGWENGSRPQDPGRMEGYVAWLEELTARNGGPVELARSAREDNGHDR